MKPTIRIKYIIHGQVQGVGFRRRAKQLAVGLHLIGSVRNLPSGAVELIVQGSLEKIRLLIESLKSQFVINQLEEIHQTPIKETSHFLIVP